MAHASPYTIRNRPAYTQEGASGLWRSEDMTLVRFHMQREAAHHIVYRLGELGMVMFQDLNKSTSAFQRDFSAEVRRCDDMERRIRYLDDEVKKNGITYLTTNHEDVEMEGLNTLERVIEKAEHDVRDLSVQFEALVTELNRTREFAEVLKRDVLGSVDVPSLDAGGLTLVCGVMPTTNVDTFQRLVYRATRGNAIVRIDEIPELFESPSLSEEISKSVFVVFFSSGRLKDKVRKLAEVSGGSIYNYVESREELQRTRAELQKRYDILGTAIMQSVHVKNLVLTTVAENMWTWKRTIATEKGVFGAMNLLQFSGPTAVGQGWVPVAKLDDVARVIKSAEKESGALVSTIIECIRAKETKPTFFNTNKVTETFQGIVDSYGIPRYKEVNPGVFTIITFPYLFGIMYGDLGHGLILTIFAAILIMFENHLLSGKLNEIFAMIFGGRYLLFGMGVFATYIGILYNDMFGISTEMFASSYTWPALPPTGPKGLVFPTYPDANPNVAPNAPCAVGIDVAWTEAENKLEYYNSFKMKCAVIIGIVQMCAGVVLSLMNHIYFKEKKQIFFRFIPEIIFLSLTFGYMALMIVIKWMKTWPNTNLAPSLLETMTNFFLAPGTVTVPLYAGQAGVQVTLLLIAVSVVPVLLAAIPYLENKENNERLHKRALLGDHHHEEENEDEDEEEGNGGGHGHGGEFDFGEVMIHQVIHTIEYVLGAVSNTASYLRLWALSLAHAQLSDVFWNFAFMMTVSLDTGSGVYIFVGFAVWLSATLGVLLGMESLSAFLHALRLHWVEFQGKFYYGDGIKFSPFNIAEILAEVK